MFLFASCGTPETAQTEESQITEPTIEIEEVVEDTKEILPMEYVTIETSKGDISVELDPNAAPVSVANFLKYVDEGFYDGTIFHRVIPNFMIQGGGMTADGSRKQNHDPIVLESQNGLANKVGTLAMARTNAPNSATSQFFINVQDNDFLNYSGGNPGYAVFGKVTAGMDVVNEIRQVETGVFQGQTDWPTEAVTMIKVTRD